MGLDRGLDVGLGLDRLAATVELDQGREALRRRIRQRDGVELHLLEQWRDLQLLADAVADGVDDVDEVPVARLDLDGAVEHVAPDGDPIGGVGRRRVLPGEDRAHYGQNRVCTAPGLGIDAQSRHVDQRLGRLLRAIHRIGDVMGVEARLAQVLPAGAVVDVGAHVLGRAVEAQAASVAGGAFDVHGRLEQVALGVEAQAVQFFVRRVADDFRDRFEPGFGHGAEVVGILGLQRSEVCALVLHFQRVGGFAVQR